MTNQQEHIDIERGREMPEEVRKAAEKQKLPSNLHQQMSAMKPRTDEDKESLFIQSNNTQRTLFAIRASVRRFYEKNGHAFKFVAHKEVDDSGAGVRIYKFQSDQSEVVSLEAD